MYVESASTPRSMVGSFWAVVLRLWRLLIPQGRFAKHVQTLLTGAASSQLILIAATPLLARLYTPGEFGLLALFTAAFTVVTQAATGRLDAAIVLTKDDLDAIHVTLAALLFSSIVVAGAVSLLAVAGPWFSETMGAAAAGGWYWWLPPAIALGACQLVGSRWHARKQRFKTISASNIAYAGGMVAVQLAGAVLPAGWKSGSLLAGAVAGLFLSVVVLAADFVRDYAAHRHAVTWRGTKSAIVRFQNFVRFSMPQALIAQMNQQAPRFVIKLLFAASVLGTYTVCLRVLMAPVLILNNALRCVLLQRISAARETPGQARRIVAMLSWRLFFLMLPFCLVFAIWADEIFGLLLGPQWTSAGKYARLLLPMVLAHGVVGSIRIGFQALEAQFAIFCMDLVSLAITVLALYAGFAFGSATIGILAYSLATAAMYAVNLAVIFYVLDPQPTGAAPAS